MRLDVERRAECKALGPALIATPVPVIADLQSDIAMARAASTD